MNPKISRLEAKALGLIPNEKLKGQAKADDEQHCARKQLILELFAAHGIPPPDCEYEFAKEAMGRNWRFDFCWGEADIALEVQGGLFVEGRHVQGAALLKEHEKLNAAVCLGWSVLFCTWDDVEKGTIFPTIRKALGIE